MIKTEINTKYGFWGITIKKSLIFCEKELYIRSFFCILINDGRKYYGQYVFAAKDR